MKQRNLEDFDQFVREFFNPDGLTLYQKAVVRKLWEKPIYMRKQVLEELRHPKLLEYKPKLPQGKGNGWNQ